MCVAFSFDQHALMLSLSPQLCRRRSHLHSAYHIHFQRHRMPAFPVGRLFQEHDVGARPSHIGRPQCATNLAIDMAAAPALRYFWHNDSDPKFLSGAGLQANIFLPLPARRTDANEISDAVKTTSTRIATASGSKKCDLFREPDGRIYTIC
ncbi:hypothetical protein BDZ89DRAFT_477876 [Hymenopellis radicata]|nr:hypothetical protein BDZ89DRAFT_477876 [Hymenopellis radicata]